MKLLYASYRYNAFDRDAGSGVDFNLCETLKELGFQLRVIGPIADKPSKIELLYRKIHRVFSRKLTAKFSMSYLRTCSKDLDHEANIFRPDVIVTHNLIPLIFCKTQIPIVYKSDAILKNMHSQWPTYSKIELFRMLNWEKKAIKKSSRIITASNWAKEALVSFYHYPESRILILPIPSSLPEYVLPPTLVKRDNFPTEINILLVAKNFHLKGGDIAIETIRILRERGYNSSLRIVGSEGKDSEHISYLGLLRKSDPAEMEKYAAQYNWAHFLIHPARYEAAGIVCGEAAAFGIPTITNNVGGLATTVKDNVSGIVLPAFSPAVDYANVIEEYIRQPEKYWLLRKSTWERYKDELNWAIAGKRIAKILENAIQENQLKTMKAKS